MFCGVKRKKTKKQLLFLIKSFKNLILNDYAIDTTNIKAVFLFGHIPVPYSGNINPDGHPDHLGAWPADVYYGDVDGITGLLVNK